MAVKWIAICGLLLWGCSKTDPPSTHPLQVPTPVGWPAPAQSTDGITEEGVALGRALFYETALSSDNTISCGSCHEQRAAFGTFDHDLSHGIGNSHSHRNALPLQNLAWKPLYGWAGQSSSMQSIILHHLESPVDMGGNLASAMQRLQQSAEYRQMHNAAFSTPAISASTVLSALEMFLLTMVSANSRFDKVLRGEAGFNLPEQTGYTIFQNKCNSCHAGVLQSGNAFKNIGLTYNPATADAGRKEITGAPADSLRFLIPSLRNVMVSYPYTRDGRVKDVYDMMEHYNSKVVNHSSTDAEVRNGISLSNFEKGQLVAFMLALTDSSFLNNPQLAPR